MDGRFNYLFAGTPQFIADMTRLEKFVRPDKLHGFPCIPEGD